MKCEKCGKQIDEVKIDVFTREGKDILVLVPIIEYENGAVGIETDTNWCGYDLTQEEQADCITCPCCGLFPFKNDEIQTHEILRVVCFKE
ncbi:MAG: hypothetical protein UHN47_05565 [Lachnospiraceae bacterium]|nr:hypothetical protein [Lachnospiraceae bacterium]